MESVAEIFIIERDAYLNVSADVLLPMSWNVNDYRELGSRGGAWSKDIMIFGDENNNRVLGELYDVNITNSSFNKNIKYRCVIKRNGEDAFDGFIRLLKVTNTSPSSTVYDENIIYNVQIYDSVSSLNQDIQGKFLDDLDLSQYDHNFSIETIVGTSANTWNQGYKYHNYFNTAGNYGLQDYHPSIFAPVYFDRILSEANYTYTFDSLSATGFNKTIVPWNGDKVKVRESILNERKFNVGFTAGTGYFRIDNNEILIYNDEDNIIHSDSGNTYNPSTGVHTVNYDSEVQFKTRFKYELYLSASTPAETTNVTTITPTVFLSASTGSIGNYFSSIDSISLAPNYTIPSGITFLSSGVTQEMTLSTTLWNGQSVWNGIKLPFYTDSWTLTGSASATSVAVLIRIAEDIVYSADTQNYWLNYPSSTQLGVYDTVYANDFIPAKVKQSDYMSSIIRKYNLFFVPPSNGDNHLEILTRDEYYDSGNVWNFDLGDAGCYLSTDNTWQIEWLHDKQKKIIRLKDKDDSDLHNKEYKDNVGETYGQVDYIFENQHIQAIDSIETIFSPTPINNEQVFNNLVSTISSESPKGNIRLLYDCGWITGNSWTFEFSLSGAVQTQSFTTYPFAGHFYPDPIEPTEDLNYQLPDYLFYNNWTRLTDNNQYNRFWKRHFSQLENGRILTGLFKLTDRFIRQFKMNDRIYVLGTYWNINSIQDYDFNSDSLTKMELVEVDEGLRFLPNTTSTVVSPPDSDYAQITNQISKDDLDAGDGNVLGGGNTGINFDGGIKNYIGYGVKNVTVVGSGNTVNDSNAFIFGSDNIIDPGIKNSFVVGDGITANTSNVFYVDNVKVINNLTLQSGATLNFSGGTISGLDYLPLSGGTVSGPTTFNAGVIFNDDIRVTGDTTIIGDVFLSDSTIFYTNTGANKTRYFGDNVTTTTTGTTSGASFTVSSRNVYHVDVICLGLKNDFSDGITVHLERSFRVDGGGNIQAIGVQTKNINTEFSAANADIAFTTTEIYVEITGQDSNTINWDINVKLTEM